LPISSRLLLLLLVVAAAAAACAGTGYKALSALSDERIAAEKGSSPAVVAKKTN
jgi:hypothetical protein